MRAVSVGNTRFVNSTNRKIYRELPVKRPCEKWTGNLKEMIAHPHPLTFKRFKLPAGICQAAGTELDLIIFLVFDIGCSVSHALKIREDYDGHAEPYATEIAKRRQKPREIQTSIFEEITIDGLMAAIAAQHVRGRTNVQIAKMIETSIKTPINLKWDYRELWNACVVACIDGCLDAAAAALNRTELIIEKQPVWRILEPDRYMRNLFKARMQFDPIGTFESNIRQAQIAGQILGLHWVYLIKSKLTFSEAILLLGSKSRERKMVNQFTNK